MVDATPVSFNSNENESSILRYQLDVENTLESIRMMLLNQKYDYVEKQIVYGEKLYEERYVDKMMHIVKSFINKELILSGYTALDIYNLMVNGMENFSSYLLSIANPSGVDDKETVNLILTSVLNHSLTNMRRSLDFKTLDHTGRAKISEDNHPNFDPNNPSYGGGRF